ncbi:gamma carbonic anhydrase family protein [Gorillibacterium sp. sgz500922]|uniref:gamma carbonic anhydrase family protein n=1 Tax=Gorillibacterium sp. sgz500922 TaxID=3446694 RepID=UPI003F6611EB
MLLDYRGKRPILADGVFVAEGAKLIGEVEVGPESGIWFNAVLRGDLAPIRIGAKVNLQDGCIGHVNREQPLLVADEVSVGHGAILHGCSIGKGSLVGMGAILLNGSELGEMTLLAAGSLVPEGRRLPAYTLCVGSPAKPLRELTDADLARMRRTTLDYIEKASEYRSAKN